MSATNDDTIKAYDYGVQAYFDQSPQKVTGRIKEWIDSALSGLSKSAKIFEIGSGTGKDADYIQSLGYNMQLSDGSKGFVEYLRSKGKEAKQFNVLHDEFDDRYSLVVADAVLLHFTEDELKKILKKINNALEDQGRLAITLKQGDGEFTEDKKLGSVRYFHLWQPEEISSIMKSCGFEISYNKSIADSREGKPGWMTIIAEKQNE